ncbi:hypothetical protein ACIGZJ_30680 [Kitasatospora sp. NPDC052868]|uniref:hypothetical protein n=1 Tax=Kitasatospora sp. NPDC052868 TaxID=3364060 RepID=UPI0037C85F9D
MRCAPLRRGRKRLGRRGAALSILGLGQISFGAGYLVQPPSGTGLGLLLGLAPINTWAWLWILAGSTTVVSAWLRIGRDWAGFFTACVPPLLWATAYGVAAATGEYERGIWIVAWYLTNHVGITLWAAGVPEHSLPRRRTRRTGGDQ